jgi:hypothetical protein
VSGSAEPGESRPRAGDAPAWGPAGWAVVAAAFAVGFANFPMQVLGAHFEYLPGDPADNRINNYILEHGYRYITGRAESFWDAPMFYPARGVTAWSDAHIGMLPFYSAMRAGGLSPEGAFQGHFLLCFVLNFASAVWALRQLGAGPAGAAAGAYVFAFGLPLAAQLPHTQLFPRFLVPLAVVFAWEFLRAPRLWRLAAAAGCWVGQTYLTVYIGYFLALLLAVGALVAVVRFRRELPRDELLRPGRREWLRRIGVAAAAGLAVLPLLVHHARGVGGVPLDYIKQLAPKPGAWVTPPSNAGAFPELGEKTGLGTGMHGGDEQQLLPGLVPLAAVALGLLALVRPGPFGGRGSAVAVAAASAVLIGLLFTRFGDVWLYEWAARLPGSGSIRAPGRVVLVLLFPAAVAVGAGADLAVRAARRAGRVPAALVALLAVAGLAADQWLARADGPRAAGWAPMRYSLETALTRQARIVEAARQHPNPTLLYVFPSAGDGPCGEMGVQLEAMRASQDLGVPCVNGWSGYLAHGWDYFPGYRALLTWLTEKNATPPERLEGLVVVGEPVPDADPAYEARMRAAYPPRPVR